MNVELSERCRNIIWVMLYLDLGSGSFKDEKLYRKRLDRKWIQNRKRIIVLKQMIIFLILIKAE